MRFDASSLERGLMSLQNRSELALRAYAEAGALKMEASAKNNAPWTDRSGSARTRLKADVQRVSRGYRIRLAHGVDYGPWLELANEKKYSIIPQTIRYVGTVEILPGLARLLERL